VVMVLAKKTSKSYGSVSDIGEVGPARGLGVGI